MNLAPEFFEQFWTQGGLPNTERVRTPGFSQKAFKKARVAPISGKWVRGKTGEFGGEKLNRRKSGMPTKGFALKNGWLQPPWVIEGGTWKRPWKKSNYGKGDQTQFPKIITKGFEIKKRIERNKPKS